MYMCVGVSVHHVCPGDVKAGENARSPGAKPLRAT